MEDIVVFFSETVLILTISSIATLAEICNSRFQRN